jgi:hypothetical protein
MTAAALLSDTRAPADAEQLLAWACAIEHADACCEWLAREGPEDWTGGYSADGCAVLMERARIGAQIQGGGLADRAACHDDAAVVYETARGLFRQEPRTFWLLIEHARRQSRPEIDPVPQFSPRYAEVRYAKAARERYGLSWGGQVIAGNNVPPFCPITWQDNSVLLDKARQEYAAWWQALRRLEFALMARDGSLRDWTVRRLRAKPRPWEG